MQGSLRSLSSQGSITRAVVGVVGDPQFEEASQSLAAQRFNSASPVVVAVIDLLGRLRMRNASRITVDTIGLSIENKDSTW